MKPKIYLFLGDGGYLFSMGFSAFGSRLAAMGYEVDRRPDSGRDTNMVRADILCQPHDRPLIFLGYSLGANGCAWNAQANRDREIALIVGFDPTVNGPSLSLYPIGRHVKRCICFMKSAAVSPDSWFFGGSCYVAAVDGPQIVVKRKGLSHLAIQFDGQLQALTVAEIQGVG